MLAALWKTYFGPKVAAGQQYTFRATDTRNPFKTGEEHRIEVLAVQGGYVNYRHTMEGSIFQNESMGLTAFHYCYKLS